MQVAHTRYFYNPDNCPLETLDWLKQHPIPRTQIEGASHWPSIDQPGRTAVVISSTLDDLSRK